MKNIKNVRKAVATLANRLNKKIRNLSNAFIRAWQMVKAQIFLTSKVAGTTFNNLMGCYKSKKISVCEISATFS